MMRVRGGSGGVRAIAASMLRPVLRELDVRTEATVVRTLRRHERSTQDRPRGDSEAELRRQVAALGRAVRRLEAEVTKHEARTYAIELLAGSDSGRNSRLLPRRQIESLAHEVARVADVPDATSPVVQAYRTLFETELRGMGRIAGSTPNILGKLATTPLLEPPNHEVLEIGTLFGLFSCALHRQFARSGVACRLTVVDPLAGVQVQGGRAMRADRSGSSASEHVVRENARLAGVSPEHFRLLKGLSTDEDVRREVSDRRYGVVVVDGDHSYEGVAADLRWAEEIVAPGGVVVLDDYGDRKWRSIERAVREHLAGETRFDMVGVVATSAFLRAR